MSPQSFCTPANCKVKRLSYFSEVERWRHIDGTSYKDIAKRCQDKDSETAPTSITLFTHFTKHYPPTSAEYESMSPERMAKLLDDNISMCTRAIKQVEKAADFRVMAQLMETQKRLLELKIQNQQMFLEREKTMPEQLDHIKEALQEIPEMYRKKIIEALEIDVHGKQN